MVVKDADVRFHVQDHPARSVTPNVLGTDHFYPVYLDVIRNAFPTAEQPRPLPTSRDTAVNRLCLSSYILEYLTSSGSCDMYWNQRF